MIGNQIRRESGSRASLAGAGCGSIAACTGAECRREAGYAMQADPRFKAFLKKTNLPE